MVNSGSIIVNSLIQTMYKPEMSGAEKFDEIMNYIKRMAGGEYVSFNNSVFLAEREVSDRNYALSYYMKENNCFPKGSKIKECVDFWYQCCAMEVNCESMAVICATLAKQKPSEESANATIGPSLGRRWPSGQQHVCLANK